MALYSLECADVSLRIYSLSLSLSITIHTCQSSATPVNHNQNCLENWCITIFQLNIIYDEIL